MNNFVFTKQTAVKSGYEEFQIRVNCFSFVWEELLH